MPAIKGAPWDDWWDNLASQGHWTLPASRSHRGRRADADGSAPEAPPSRTEEARPPERVSVPWREIEDLHATVNQLDEERRRLADNLQLAQKSLEESARLRASLEFLEAENLSLRLRLTLLDGAGSEPADRGPSAP